MADTSASSPEFTPASQSSPSVAAAGPVGSVGAVGFDALAILDQIPVEREHRGGYARKLFTLWVDADGDGCNARDEVLIAESLTHAQVDPFGCAVIAGDWLSVYDGVATEDPSALDIDHVVPLKEAWDSGAWLWSPQRRELFANDLTDDRTLQAVTASSNRSKGDRDPSNWIPDAADTCTYVANWIAIKARWGLSMDQSEHGRLGNLIRQNCTGLDIAPWPAVPAVPAEPAAPAVPAVPVEPGVPAEPAEPGEPG